MKGKMKAPRRCGYCLHLIVGDAFLDAGVEYCSVSCQRLGMHRRVMRAQSPWYIVLAIIATLLTMAATSYFQPAKAHDPYSGWVIPGQSKSCCNMKDCRPTPAKFEKGSWWAKHRNHWIKVPDDRIVNYKTDDTDAHLCISESDGEIFCFRPPKLSG